MRSLCLAPLISFALLTAACSPPPQTYSAETAAGAAGPPRDAQLEVSVQMSSEPEEEDLAEGGLGDGDKRSKRESTRAAPQPITEAKPPPPPPPPPPPSDLKQKQRPESTSPQAATADSAGAKVDSTTIQQAIAKNVASFKPCLRSDMALRLEATISPSGDVLEARSPRSFPDDAQARDCVVLALKRLRFERFDGSVPARVSFELTLKRAIDY